MKGNVMALLSAVLIHSSGTRHGDQVGAGTVGSTLPVLTETVAEQPQVDGDRTIRSLDRSCGFGV